MIILDNGNYAGVRALTYFARDDVEREGIAFWVRGFQQTLSSDNYASCVGLVLRGDVSGYGAVVHFWNPSGLADAKVIVDQYMQWLLQQTGGYCGDDVEAVVFGGTSFDTTTGAQFTTPRMKDIRSYLEDRWDMRVVVATEGSSKVSIDLAGVGPIEEFVTLDRGTLASKPHEASVSAKSKAASGRRIKRSPSLDKF